jgi:DNA-binding GntR family transcriptional regulator
MPAALARIEAAPDYVEQVCRALVGAIASGQFGPGERLTQEDIARRLNVSRQPVLQALRLLKKDGLVEDAPGRGLQVTALDGQLIARVYEVRGALDALAARLAALRRAALDPALIAAGRRAVASQDVQAMIDADLAFHHAVYAASGNPLLAPAAEVHWLQVRRAMGAALQRSVLRDTVWDEHEAIVHAIAAGQAEQAERLMTAHTQRAAEYMVAQLAGRPAAAAAPGRHPSAARSSRF